jgi:hypothetical protein
MLLDDRDIDNSQEQLDQQLHPDVGQLAHQPPDLNSILVCTSERERETDRQRERERERERERDRETERESFIRSNVHNGASSLSWSKVSQNNGTERRV